LGTGRCFSTVISRPAPVGTTRQGDFDETKHVPGYISDMHLLPDQTDEQEREIVRLHKELVHMTAQEAEAAYVWLATRRVACFAAWLLHASLPGCCMLRCLIAVGFVA